MAVLVCGGAGYIGSHFVKELISRGDTPIVVDSLITGHRSSLPEDVGFYEMDLMDREGLRKVFSENSIDAVVHFAAASLVGESMKKPLYYFRNNFCATENLLEAMEEAGVRRLIFSSTAAVYGNPEVELIDENTVPAPINPYGESKLAMEKMIRWQSNAGNLDYVALRYFNVAGASLDGSIGEDHRPETHIIPNIIRAAMEGRDFRLFGSDFPTPDGTCVRDYIHVVDLCRAHYDALTYLRNGGASDVFNLGYGRGFSNLEVVEAVRKATGLTFNVNMEGRRAGDPPRLVADSSKARNVLKWKPELDDMEKIADTAYRFLKAHPEGYQD